MCRVDTTNYDEGVNNEAVRSCRCVGPVRVIMSTTARITPKVQGTRATAATFERGQHVTSLDLGGSCGCVSARVDGY